MSDVERNQTSVMVLHGTPNMSDFNNELAMPWFFVGQEPGFVFK